MKFFALFPYYFVWHYTVAVKSFLKIWRNFAWFAFNLFSISMMWRTLIDPVVGAKSLKILSGIVGSVIKILIIVIGILAVAVIVFGGLLVFLVWLLLPLITTLFFISGLLAVLGIQITY